MSNIVDTVAQVPHQTVNWIGAGVSWLGVALTSVGYILGDPQTIASLPHIVAVLPDKGIWHETGVILMALGPIFSVIRGMRPR
jgi:hypothetical protein